eukprot:471065-Amphidinium_carterae.1
MSPPRGVVHDTSTFSNSFLAASSALGTGPSATSLWYTNPKPMGTDKTKRHIDKIARKAMSQQLCYILLTLSCWGTLVRSRA